MNTLHTQRPPYAGWFRRCWEGEFARIDSRMPAEFQVARSLDTEWAAELRRAGYVYVECKRRVDTCMEWVAEGIAVRSRTPHGFLNLRLLFRISYSHPAYHNLPHPPPPPFTRDPPYWSHPSHPPHPSQPPITPLALLAHSSHSSLPSHVSLAGTNTSSWLTW